MDIDQIAQRLRDSGYDVDVKPQRNGTAVTISTSGYAYSRITIPDTVTDKPAWLLERLGDRLNWHPDDEHLNDQEMTDLWHKYAALRAQERLADPNWDEALYTRLSDHAEKELRESKLVFEPMVLTERRAWQMMVHHKRAEQARGISDKDASSELDINGEVTQQRPMSGRRRDNMIAAVVESEWMMTHQGVGIAPDGYILDGQHRVETVLKSGYPIPILVVRHVRDKTFGVIDTGKARSGADIARMMGVGSNASKVTSAVRLVYWFDSGAPVPRWYKSPITNESLIRMVTGQYKMVVPWLDFAKTLAKHESLRVPVEVAAAVMYLSHRAWPDGETKMREFWTVVSHGRVTDADHPALALRNWAIGWSDRRTTRSGVRSRKIIEHLLVSIRAWNAFCEERTLGMIGSNPRYDTPTVYTP